MTPRARLGSASLTAAAAARAAAATLAAATLAAATLAAATLAPSVAHASALDRQVAQLVVALELEQAPGFSLGADLALGVTTYPTGGGDGLPELVLGLLRARLEELGARALVVLPFQAAADLAALEEAARAGGAEWLLQITIGPASAARTRLDARLRAVDRGLWVAPPAPGASGIYASAELLLDPPPGLGRVGDTDPRPVRGGGREPSRASTSIGRFGSSPARLATLDERVLALAACRFGGPAARELVFALGERTLYAFSFDGRALSRAAALDLSSLSRARAPARDPLGTLVCGRSELLLGHGALERGHTIEVVVPAGEDRDRPAGPAPRAGPRELGLRFGRTLPGLPLGVLPGGKVLFGDVDGGRNRLGRLLRADGIARETRAPLEDVLLDPDLPAGSRAFGVSVAHQLVRLGDDLELSEAVVGTGAGARVFTSGETVLAVTTSSISSGDRDRLRLWALEPRAARRLDALDVGGGVFATVIVGPALGPRELLFAAWRGGARKSELYAVDLASAAGDGR